MLAFRTLSTLLLAAALSGTSGGAINALPVERSVAGPGSVQTAFFLPSRISISRSSVAIVILPTMLSACV